MESMEGWAQAIAVEAVVALTWEAHCTVEAHWE